MENLIIYIFLYNYCKIIFNVYNFKQNNNEKRKNMTRNTSYYDKEAYKELTHIQKLLLADEPLTVSKRIHAARRGRLQEPFLTADQNRMPNYFKRSIRL